MQEKGTEVHIDRSDDRRIIVRYDALRVQEAWAVFIDLDARAVQLLVIGARNHIDQLFNPGIPGVRIRTSTPDCAAMVSAVIISLSNTRYGGRDIDVIARVVDDLQVGRFADVQIVKRRIRERLDIAVLRHFHRRQVGVERRHGLAGHIFPHLQRNSEVMLTVPSPRSMMPVSFQ